MDADGRGDQAAAVCNLAGRVETGGALRAVTAASEIGGLAAASGREVDDPYPGSASILEWNARARRQADG